MNAIDTMPPRTVARILEHLAGLKFMKLELATIAGQHHVTLADLQAVLNKHGYPDQALMRKHARRLESAADTEAAETVTAAAEPVTHAHQNGTTPPATVSTTDEDGGAELGTLIHVPVNKLHPDPDNPRDRLTDIEELAESIAEAGLLQPIVVRRHAAHLYVVAGHRRLAAIKLLKWTEAPCIIRTRMRPDQVLAAMIIENGQRVDLDPIEEARGLARLKLQWDCSDLELARRIGRSQPAVSSRLALLSLTPEEQEQVRRGDMTLIEAAHQGRLNSGRVRDKGQDKNWHLSPTHDLATKAKARCNRLDHPRGRKVGGMACGACWETVIRTDEREHLIQASLRLGKCPTCDTHIEGATA